MEWGFEDHCWNDLYSLGDLEIYKHYWRDTYIGPRPALLAIDLYNMAFAGGSKPVQEVAKEYPSSYGEYAWDAIESTKQLFSLARARKFPIFYTTGEDRIEARPSLIRATNRRPGKSVADPTRIFDAYTPQAEDIIVYKQRASAFYGTPLVAHLTQLGIDSLIICGESTSGCVRASVLDAYSNGFHVVLAEECIFDRSLLSHKVNLFDMHHKYADVMHIAELAELLRIFPKV